MPAKTLETKVDELSMEVARLRSMVIGLVSEKDPEGEYRPAFVKKVLKAMNDKSMLVFEGKGSLLRQLKHKK
jgi:hypothetical protein